jgi:hypothetical protein
MEKDMSSTPLRSSGILSNHGKELVKLRYPKVICLIIQEYNLPTDKKVRNDLKKIVDFFKYSRQISYINIDENYYNIDYRMGISNEFCNLYIRIETKYMDDISDPFISFRIFGHHKIYKMRRSIYVNPLKREREIDRINSLK